MTEANFTGNFDALIQAARAGSMPAIVRADAEHQIAFLPLGDNGQGRLVDLERIIDKPRRKIGTVRVFNTSSFNLAIAQNSGGGVSGGDASIYVDRDPTNPAIVAVLNGHGVDGPGWGDHRVEIEFRRTPAWLRWTGIDCKMLSQGDFAEFIEDNLEDIHQPDGATMLEIAMNLEATKSGTFKSSVSLSDGTYQFQSSDQVDARVGTKLIAVPKNLVLSLSPFQGMKPYAVPARFRFRLEEGCLRMGIKLQLVDKMMEHVLGELVADIERNADGPIYDGRAPTAQPFSTNVGGPNAR